MGYYAWNIFYIWFQLNGLSCIKQFCHHGLCIVLKSIIHPSIGKHNISGGNHSSITWNVHLMERFLFSNKLIFTHSTSNLYATWHDSSFKFQSSKITHLDLWFYAFNRPTCDINQVTNFRDDDIVFIFLCIQSLLLYASWLVIICIQSTIHGMIQITNLWK
jgi:hypothetical protein